MNHYVGSFVGRFVIVLLLVATVGAGSAPFLFGASEEDEAGICAKALSNCLGTAGGAALAADWRSLIKALLICLAGYEFCVNYVEPYIRDEVRP